MLEGIANVRVFPSDDGRFGITPSANNTELLVGVKPVPVTVTTVPIGPEDGDREEMVTEPVGDGVGVGVGTGVGQVKIDEVEFVVAQGIGGHIVLVVVPVKGHGTGVGVGVGIGQTVEFVELVIVLVQGPGVGVGIGGGVQVVFSASQIGGIGLIGDNSPISCGAKTSVCGIVLSEVLAGTTSFNE